MCIHVYNGGLWQKRLCKQKNARFYTWIMAICVSYFWSGNFQDIIYFLTRLQKIFLNFGPKYLQIYPNLRPKVPIANVSGVVMGPGQNFLTRVRVNFLVLGSDRVSHLWFGFEFGKFPQKMSNFSIFSLRVKKISSGHVRKYPGQRRVSLLFTGGQK